jgi:two-component system heavy metal sensor histidine kinase CusS
MWPKSARPEALPRSLALRLTAVFGLLGYVLVGLVGLFLYSSVRYSVQAQVDREIATTARVLLHRLDEDREAPDKEWLDLGEHLALRILDRQGAVLLESPGMGHRAPPSVFPAAGDGWDRIPVATPQRGHLRLRALDFGSGRIQLARDTTDEEWMLRRLRNAVLWVFLAAPALAALLGYRLVRLGLAPLGSLVRGLEDLKPETLGTRVDARAVPAELAPLAGALNAALARLEQAFSRLSELNADLAHELRTPLHSLRLEAEDLLSRPDLPEPVLERLGGMMETLDHLASVIEQMLTLSSFEDPSRHLETEDLDAHALLAAAAAPFEYLAEEAGVRVASEAPAGLRVRGNATLLRRALHNLLANALRHSPERGEVRLRARAEGGTVVLEVEDEGEGMPAELRAQVGRRFLRPDASRSRRTGGTGLGLAIVRGIAELHGGRLEIRGAIPRGSVIQIILPGT